MPLSEYFLGCSLKCSYRRGSVAPLIERYQIGIVRRSYRRQTVGVIERTPRSPPRSGECSDVD